MPLAGAVALVTGASGGLGSRIATELAARGCDIAAAYCSDAKGARASVEAVAKAGRRGQTFRVDVADPAAVSATIAAVVEDFGRLDILINNAGQASAGHSVPPGDLEALTPEIWNDLLAINLTGPYLMARAAAPHLRASPLGRIVNIGTTMAHGPFNGAAPYAPSKASAPALTRFLAAALAPDVTVNCVSPGLMEGTKMSGAAPDSYIGWWADAALLKRTTSLSDVARQVVAFCEMDSVTGQSIAIDAGMNFS